MKSKKGEQAEDLQRSDRIIVILHAVSSHVARLLLLIGTKRTRPTLGFRWKQQTVETIRSFAF